MKKSFLLLIAFTTISISLFAQPTLTSSIIPKVGDFNKNVIINPSTALQGPAGANQTWDFSSLGTGTNVETDYVAVSATTYASDFPSASIAGSDGNGNYSYTSSSSGDYEIWGAESTIYQMIYTNSLKALTFPFTYNNTLNDNFTGGSYDTKRTGSINVKADAYGTLKTPAGTFNNVLRLSIKQTMIDTEPGAGASVYYWYQTYDWYADGLNNVLLSISFDTSTYLGTTTITDMASYGTDIPAGINNVTPSFSFTAYPNPTTDKFLITTVESINHVVISNVLGQIVKDMPIEHVAPNTPVEVSVAELPVGIYSCTVTTPSGSVTRKIVKE